MTTAPEGTARADHDELGEHATIQCYVMPRPDAHRHFGEALGRIYGRHEAREVMRAVRNSPVLRDSMNDVAQAWVDASLLSMTFAADASAETIEAWMEVVRARVEDLGVWLDVMGQAAADALAAGRTDMAPDNGLFHSTEDVLAYADDVRGVDGLRTTLGWFRTQAREADTAALDDPPFGFGGHPTGAPRGTAEEFAEAFERAQEVRGAPVVGTRLLIDHEESISDFLDAVGYMDWLWLGGVLHDVAIVDYVWCDGCVAWALEEVRDRLANLHAAEGVLEAAVQGHSGHVGSPAHAAARAQRRAHAADVFAEHVRGVVADAATRSPECDWDDLAH